MVNPETSDSRSSIGLYVHLPFCRSRCFYCDFYSETDDSRAGRLLAVLVERIESRLNLLGSPSISTVYVGGGTPSVVDRKLLKGLLAAIKSWKTEAYTEWTVEANPESVDQEFLDLCQSAGVTRLSLGLQSFDEKLLTLLGRGTSGRDNLVALEMISEGWIGLLSVDLLVGIPGQDQPGLLSDLGSALAYRPDHVSLYSLTREVGTEYDRRIAIGQIKSLSDEKAEDLWLTGRQTLIDAGYANYEISNFARSGRVCHHNMAYWHLTPYLGEGPSAVSTLPGGPTGVVRVTQPRSIAAYLEARGSIIEEVSPKDFVFETLMMGLRLEEGVPLSRIRDRFGPRVTDRLVSLWGTNAERWGCRISEDRLTFGDKGRLLLNRALQEILEEIEGWSDLVETRWPG